MTERDILVAALKAWLRTLTEGGYPATAVVEFIDELTFVGMPKFARAERQLAITALSRFGPRHCPLRDELEKREEEAMRGDESRRRHIAENFLHEVHS